MKVYKLYAKIPKDVFETKLRFLVPNSSDYTLDDKGYYIGLYGVCKKKSVLKEFLELRNKSVFIIKEDDIDDDTMQFRVYSNLEIVRSSLNTFDHENMKPNKIKVAIVLNEKTSCTDYPREYLNEMYPSVYDELPVSLFNKKIIDCLEVLGYSSRYYSDYGSLNMKELATFNDNYYLSPNGFTLITKNDPDQLGFLLYLYKYTFFGYDNMGKVTD